MSKGIIVCGHGQFGVGLTHSLEMIAGKQSDYEVVVFSEDAPFEKLSEDLTEAKERLLETNQGVVFCCDLLGGSPFKAAMTIANEDDRCAVVVGTNLPLLLDLALSRGMNEDESVEELAQRDIEYGKQGLMFVPKIVMDEVEDDNDFEEGI